jgi:vacuolar-type H+-ATPase subunit C/Vma6
MTKLTRSIPIELGSPGAGERAYAYAKACGIIGKSFVGKRVVELRGLRLLSELDRLVFPEARRDQPDKELLVDIEKSIEKRAVRHILAMVNSYTEPPDLLIRQLGAYEYSDLKTCLHYIAGGIKTIPPLCDIGRFRTIRFKAFPNLAAMLRGTSYEFILSENIKTLKPDSREFTAIETELDTHFYLGLIDSLTSLSGEDRAIAYRILTDEISLRNCIWAMRLRTYFRKTYAETSGQLMKILMQTDITIDLASDAMKSLNLPLDSRSPWRGWKWEKFLNPEKSSEHWNLDPRYFQNAASRYLYRLALKSFHRAPMSVSTIFCFIKIKQFEEDLLTSIAEGLGMGMSGTEVFEMLTASTDASLSLGGVSSW